MGYSFIIIKTKNDGIFISDNVKAENYFRTQIPNLFFDNKTLIPTFKETWYKIEKLPETIKKKQADKYINKRYELKNGFLETDLTPSVIVYDEFDDGSDIAGLYSYNCDKIEGELEEVEFDYEILSEEENFYTDKPKYSSTPTLMSQLTIHPALQLERPVFITGKQFYNIIRNHIKANIDGRYAIVSSDYDFCLSVEKVIKLAESKKYTIDIGTKRRPKYIDKYNTDKRIKVFETSPEGYSNYPTQEGIQGKNQKDLEYKVDAYLKDLMDKINQPLKECPDCKGVGCIIETNNYEQ